jgi:predicted O-methyltransferase YrrM
VGLDRSWTPEFGRLLRTLAGTVRAGVLAEVGTGVGVGAAWLLGGMRSGTRPVTVEADPGRAEAAAAAIIASRR